MNLTPREKDKLLVAMAAMVARRRLERGCKLNHPEAIALITDSVVEGARDGRSVAELMQRKFFVDELYEAVFVRFGGWVSGRAAWFDRNVVDGLVNASGAGSQATGRLVRRSQSGLTRGYLAAMLTGTVAVVAVLLAQVV